MKKILMGLIRFYRKNISPYKRGSHCRFTPTCSIYALEAIDKYGALKGTNLLIKRIIKCHPLSKYSGYDPVP